MAAISDLPNIEVLITNLVQIDKLSHKEISIRLRQMYPMTRGLSPGSVRRFCRMKGIHRTSRLADVQVDEAVASSINEVQKTLNGPQLCNTILQVGSAYGRKLMKGYLASKGIYVAENRVGKSLRCMDPNNHILRTTLTHYQTNPRPYSASYFGHKIHIDQNEKLVMFGVTHVAAIDGYSGRIIAAVLMPIKNCVSIYEHVYM